MSASNEGFFTMVQLLLTHGMYETKSTYGDYNIAYHLEIVHRNIDQTRAIFIPWAVEL